MGYVGAPGCERWAYTADDEADELTRAVLQSPDDAVIQVPPAWIEWAREWLGVRHEWVTTWYGMARRPKQLEEKPDSAIAPYTEARHRPRKQPVETFALKVCRRRSHHRRPTAAPALPAKRSASCCCRCIAPRTREICRSLGWHGTGMSCRFRSPAWRAVGREAPTAGALLPVAGF